jgi:hypothetical protein
VRARRAFQPFGLRQPQYRRAELQPGPLHKSTLPRHPVLFLSQLGSSAALSVDEPAHSP